jgi:transcriptional regulator with XRE-family HTH domain
MNTKFKKLVQEQNITLKDLAKQLRVSRVHLTNIANGAPAGKQLAKKIEAWSGGLISHSELLYPG